MNRDKSSSSQTPTTSTQSSSSTTTHESDSSDQLLEGNVIKVKSGFYDGKLGYITGIIIIITNVQLSYHYYQQINI